ncbi:helix-hairpin-helix domain-containing protein [Bacillus sp. FJAT-27445]|uniref:helix-hairpin-helix domain-containing protein n=1 Tax=Bacillus sp. FJAT-27445 TaxID=1679166 RepID=UPI00074317D2|nr:helix-hairpin-helix domain-containing protein [Bacillus sp. FJAT-27445]
MKEWLNQNKQYAITAVAAISILAYFMFKEQALELQPDTDIVQTVEERPGPAEEFSQIEPAIILVDVKGEVKKPGVYQAEISERVIDMIERAGGLTKKADARQVNFAQKLEDEMVVFIPSEGEESSEPSLETGTEKDGKININKADLAGLQGIPGIGPAKAAAIIEYREKNGPFKNPAQLKEISGIGDKTFDKLEASITVR